MNSNRKALLIISLFVLFALSIGLPHTAAKNLNEKVVKSSPTLTVKVNPFIKLSDWEGWGTSLCWTSNSLGAWPEANRNELEDLLFDKNKGLGLNIARYNIGGGDNPQHSHQGGWMPGFEPSDGVYDWTADENQRTVLKEAIARGVNITEAFSNSPPYWMTNSQCSSGAVDGGNNLKEDYYEKFADYLTEVVKHYRDYWGITFNSLEPINEPINVWKEGNWQEGCHFDTDKQSKIIKLVSKSLKDKGLDSTILAASDETGFDAAERSFTSWDSVTKSCVSKINSHQYAAKYSLPLTEQARAYNKKLWMSEVCVGYNEKHDHNSITSGLKLGADINQAVKYSGVSAWVYWLAIENERDDNLGCIHVDFSKKDYSFSITKQYYVFENYTKFIKQGYTMIDAGDENTLAAYSKKDRKLVLVCCNDQSEDNKINYDLSGFEKLGYNVQVYRTSSTENLKKLNDLGFAGKTLSVVSRGNSVTTYVVSIAIDSSSSSWSKAKEILKDTIVLKAGKDYILRNGMNFALDTYSYCLPQLKSSKLYVPIDLLLQKFGGTLMKGYNYDDKKIRLNIKGQKTVEYTIGSKVMIVNGKKVNMTLAPKLVDDSEMNVELDAFIKSVAGMKLIYSGDMAIIYNTGKKIDVKKDKAAIDFIKKLFI